MAPGPPNANGVLEPATTNASNVERQEMIANPTSISTVKTVEALVSSPAIAVLLPGFWSAGSVMAPASSIGAESPSRQCS